MLLGYRDEEVWAMTPRKFYSQLLVHREMNSYKDKEDSSQEEGYIDQIAGW